MDSSDEIEIIGEDIIQVPLMDPKCERRVLTSRFERSSMIIGLLCRLALGTIYEIVRRLLARCGIGNSTADRKSAFFNDHNMNLIADRMCELRGAALKLGQIISMQDPKTVSPELMEIFDRVRQRAYYMPDCQLQQCMIEAFGEDWKSKFASFTEKPFAAASIGQVHQGILLDGTSVAVKVQYLDIAKSIESDMKNLVLMLRLMKIFPRGLFIDDIIKKTKLQLAWEVDYEREREYQSKYRDLIVKREEFYVPKVYDEMSSGNVLTTELVPGVPIDRCSELDTNKRNFIGKSMIKLFFVELFEMQCMQPDSNWSNFLYDDATKKIMLLDFGATRFYSDEFIAGYKEYLRASVEQNRVKLSKLSLAMRFQTEEDNTAMEEAVLNMALMFGEIFRNETFDFGASNLSERFSVEMKKLIENRSSPPPGEIYPINRKLSGIMSLCSKFNVKIDCRKIFNDIVGSS